MKRTVIVTAAALLLIAACGTSDGSPPASAGQGTPDTVAPTGDEPAAVDEPVAVDEPAAVDEPVAVDEPAAVDEPVAVDEPGAADRAAVEAAVSGRLFVDAPADVTGDQIACVASGVAAAIDADRLEGFASALDEPSESPLSADAVSDTERDRILDRVSECLPWSRNLLTAMQSIAGTPPGVLECAQETPAADADRAAADLTLFGGDLMAAYNLLIPAGCLEGAAAQAATPAGRLTAAQLIQAGVSPESAGCVAAQVDALAEALEEGSDEPDAGSEQDEAMFAAIFSCLTPDELALVSDPSAGADDG